MTNIASDPVKPNILVVDDRADNLLVMRAIFDDAPQYNILTVSSGLEAIKTVKTTDLALILLDIQMPGMDGYETARAIKKLDEGRDIPIMMVTANFREDPHILNAYSAGAIDYMAKPFNADILKAKVNIYANLYIKSRQIVAQTRYLLEAQKVLMEEKNTRAIFDTLPVGVIVADKAGTISQMNREAHRIWAGEKLVDINHYSEYVGWWPQTGEPVKSHEWALARAIEQGATSRYEIINIMSFEGVKKVILNSAAPIRGSEGAIIGAVDVMQEITSEGLPVTLSAPVIEGKAGAK
jgi:CheY-like chemotaxis protein